MVSELDFIAEIPGLNPACRTCLSCPVIDSVTRDQSVLIKAPSARNLRCGRVLNYLKKKLNNLPVLCLAMIPE